MPGEWEFFLPENSVVMAVRGESSAGVAPEVAPEAAPATAPEPPAALLSSDPLPELQAQIAGCTRCKLSKTRTHLVFGEGNPHAQIFFVGEGPGEQEDLQGRPFVGKAGQLLDKMIQALGLERKDVYIANVVKCRPPGNRNPEPDEIASCSPFLARQIDAVRPRVLVALGKFAVQTLLGTEERITQIRGQFREYRGIPLMPTYHPAYLLRNPESKREAWQDLQAVARKIALEIPARKSS